MKCLITVLLATILLSSCAPDPRTDEVFIFDDPTQFQFKLFSEHDLSGPIESTGKTAEGKNNPIYDESKIPDRCWVQKRTISSDDSELCLLLDDTLTCGETRYLFPLEYVCPAID